VYCYWVLYSGLSEVPGSCNTFGRKSELQIILGFVIAAASLAFAAFNASSHPEALTLSDNKSKHKQDELLDSAPVKYAGDEEAGTDKTESPPGSTEVEDDSSPQTTPFRFQIIMACAACYACMLLTDWGEATNDNHGSPGMTSVWIQIVSGWAAALLYIWSLVAPYLLTNRQF